MDVAMIGTGKLGCPVACAMVQQGHTVYCYDNNVELTIMLKGGLCDFYEPDIENILRECLDSGRLVICDELYEAVKPAEIIFIAVPTPSLPNGAFDTSIVADVVDQVTDVLLDTDDYKVVAIISTVLPGTVRNEFLPILTNAGLPEDNNYGLAYNAQFIAMGTVIDNMLHPEFVLIGEYDERSGDVLQQFYEQLTDAPIVRMSIESAEVVKVCYNTYIGFKIIIANTIMEICDKTRHANCDVVSDALNLAKQRLWSPRYTKGGMGDGGPCHPRDARALSYLADQLNLSTDPFDYITNARGLQSYYLAQLIAEDYKRTKLPVALLGLTFKPETNLITDSPALLLMEQLLQLLATDIRGYDPIIDPCPLPDEPHIYVLAMRHPELANFPFVPGSIIIDPWRMLSEPPEGCVLRSIGVGQNPTRS